MQQLQGIAVSPGVAIGEALVIDSEGFRIPRRFVKREAIDGELARLHRAVAASAMEIEQNREAISQELGKEYGAIFEAHLHMLQDSRLRGEVEEMVRQRTYTAEYAVSRTLRRYVKNIQNLQNTALAERANDFRDLEKRLLRNLLGERREDLTHLTSPVLLLAHNLTPSETANLDREHVLGFVTEIGGPEGHTAIVAKALQIPAVVGLGPFLADVSGGETVIIDGDKGLVILQPDEEVLRWYQQEAEELRQKAAQLECLRDLPGETADGVRIALFGNIEFPYEVDDCLARGADGIGLYRTEFLYLGAREKPDEETHFEAYSGVVRAMQGRPVVIRTFDLGADKMSHMPNPEREEPNPFLGLRSIRLALRHLPLFRTQLRAVLRASALGNVQLMFPLISTLLEFRQAKMVLADVMEDLEEHGIDFDRNLKVGMMVEVPSAVMMIDRFVEEVDFLSIGTNDLVQYTLAVDRSNKEVANLYNSSDPAVLKLIQTTVEAAARVSLPVSLCGQMSGSPTYTMLLLGLGIRALSVPPRAIPEIKRVCRSLRIDLCEAVTKRALTMENARDIKRYLKEELKKCAPELGTE